jgi:hypothetical protein
MIIVCIAHADASTKAPRRLTDIGTVNTKAALQRAYDLVKELRSDAPLTSMRLISSPACRCLETILMAGDEFGRDFAHLDQCPGGMDRVKVLEQLSDGHQGIDLLGITQGLTVDLVAIALHGDLSMVPPLNPRQLATLDPQGFFSARPVIAVLQRKENDLTLKYVEGFYKGKWKNLKVQDSSKG